MKPFILCLQWCKYYQIRSKNVHKVLGISLFLMENIMSSLLQITRLVTSLECYRLDITISKTLQGNLVKNIP